MTVVLRAQDLTKKFANAPVDALCFELKGNDHRLARRKWSWQNDHPVHAPRFAEAHFGKTSYLDVISSPRFSVCLDELLVSLCGLAAATTVRENLSVYVLFYGVRGRKENRRGRSAIVTRIVC